MGATTEGATTVGTAGVAAMTSGVWTNGLTPVTSGINDVRAWSGSVVDGTNDVPKPTSGRGVVVIKADVVSGSNVVVVAGRVNPWSNTGVVEISGKLPVVNVVGVAKASVVYVKGCAKASVVRVAGWANTSVVNPGVVTYDSIGADNKGEMPTFVLSIIF